MLSFWIMAIAMVGLTLAVLGRAVLQGRARQPEAPGRDIDVYRAQLAEVERDRARGIVPGDEAERLRTEIARRILQADAQAPRTGGGRGPAGVAIGLSAGLLLAGGVLLYQQLGAPGYGDLALRDRIAFAEEMRRTRPDQASAVASLPAFAPLADLSADYLRLMEQLRETVANRPDDLTGHVLLAENEANIGNFAGSADAQAGVVRIKGDETTVKELARLGELYVLAAGGYVSPEAEMALRAALARDSDNGTARYYLALMLVQTGRPDMGFRIWDRQLREGPADAPWIAPIRQQIAEVAQLAGVDYELPPAGTGTRGPSQDDIDAAGDMTPAERMEMISGMVAGLSDRLAREGGPPGDWARLITSLGVLGQRDRAAAIYENALEVFAADPAALDIITRAGEQAGVAG